MIRILYTTLFSTLLFIHVLSAQSPQNDQCSSPIILGKAPVCPNTIYSNKQANPSSNEISLNPFCRQDGNNDRDVWFSFSTSAITDYSITVKSAGNQGIIAPNIGIYRGDCIPGGLVKICADTAFAKEDLMSINVFGLSSNETYLIRVCDEKGSGSFQLCIGEYKITTLSDFGSSACEGIVYDSGGPDKDYQNNENNIFTICPKEEHKCIRFTLNNYNIETGDSILFYNGPDTTSPIIRKIVGQDFNSGFNAGGSGFDVYASSNCLTIRFVSDSSGVYQGFYGKWYCTQEACPNFKSMILDTSPDDKAIETAVARPGTQVKLKAITCGSGKFNYGIFNAIDNSDLGLGTGIVLSSGDIRKINQPANLLSSTSLKLKGDQDLDLLSIIEGGSISKDACVMEFDVFASTDEINFEYIFGSEEYPEYISDPTFYDIFALMIDGPGIVGDPKIAPRKNLAVLPNGTQISIGQVNSSSNYEYYRNNFDGKEIVYNGLTTAKNGIKKTLTAHSKVIPCNTYHLKLAIADRGDENFDSGVFIGDIKGSAPEIAFKSALGLDNLIENCSGSGEKLIFKLNNPATTAISFQVGISGTATRDIDYLTNVPTVITFAPGVTELAFPLTVISDNITENNEFIEITLSKNFGCGMNEVSATKIFIKDNMKLKLNIPDTLFICQNTTGNTGAFLTATGANRYHWQIDADFSRPFDSKTFFNPSKTGWYFVTGTTEYCSATDSFYVNLIQPKLQIDTLGKTSICEGESLSLVAVNNFKGQFLEWTPVSIFSNNKLEKVTFKPAFSGMAIVTAKIGTCTVADTLAFNVNRINMPALTKFTEACYKEKVKLAAQTFAPSTKFTWSPTGPSDPSLDDVFVQALSNQNYILKGESNGCIAFDTAIVKISGKVDIDSRDTIYLCRGTSKRMNANIEGLNSGTGLNFQWKSKTAVFSPADSVQTTLLPISSGWIYAQVNTSKCLIKDSVYVIVDSLPDDLGLINVPAKPLYCKGDTILLYSASIPLPLYPDAKFLWQNPIYGAISSINKANLKFVAEQSALYIRKIDNVSCHRTDTFSITVLPKLPEILIENDTVCVGKIATLQIKNASDYEKFDWQPTVSLSCSDCAKPQTSQGGNYMITASKNGYCPSVKSVAVVQIGVQLSIKASKLIYCQNDNVETQLDVSPATTVFWSPSQGLSCTDCTRPIATETGRFTVTTNQDGCKSAATVDIFKVQDTIQLPAKLTICNDEQVKITIPNDSIFREFSISPFADKTGNELTIPKSGKYIINARTKKGNCAITQNLLVTKGIIPDISISASPGILTVNHKEVKLFANASSNLDPGTLLWQDNSKGSSLTAHPKSTKSDYWVSGSSPDGCQRVDSISIYSVDVPSVFSPESQGENAIFKIFQLPPSDVAAFKSLVIIDRWGKIVFETKNADQTWSGEKYASDVYLFYLTFDLKNEKKSIVLTGDLTLIR